MLKTQRTRLAGAISGARTIGLVGCASAAVLLGASMPAAAGEVDVLKDQVQTLMQRIEQLESRQQSRQAQQDEALARQDQELIELQRKQDAVLSEAKSYYLAPSDAVQAYDVNDPFSAENDPWGGGIAPANAVTAGDQKGTWKLPGSDTSFSMSGYIKGDMQVDFGPDTGFIFSSEGLSRGTFTGAGVAEQHIKFHARQSRLRAQSWSPTKFGMLKTHLEGDFFGAQGTETISNSHGFRLRHALGCLGKWCIGQTWTNAMFLAFGASTSTFGSAPGMPFLRQGQIRYTTKLSKTGTVVLSLENPQSVIAGAPAAGNKSGDGSGVDFVPDFVATYKYRNKGTLGQLTGVVRQLRVDDGVAADDTEVGYMIMGAFKIPIAKTDAIRAWASYGDGGQRYQLGGIIAGAPDGRFVNGEIKTAAFWTAGASYQHRWNKTMQSFLDYGRWDNQDAGTSALASGGTTNNANRLLANLIWTPWPRVRYFLEGIYGFGDNQAGPGGSDTSREAFRINVSGQISF